MPIQVKYRAVTTFPEGAEYAQEFLESYTKHWDAELFVYYEGKKPEFKHKLIKYYSLDRDKTRKDFLERNKNREKPQSDPGNSYRWDWDRFCHKIFALTHPRNTKAVETLIWLDADVHTIDTVDEAFLDTVCKGDVSYVGRDHFTHPDCAFVSYKLTRGKNAVLEALRETYETDNLFKFEEWHDSHVFHEIAKAAPEGYAVNLSPGIKGMQVFDDCILGSKMRHKKGPLRKKNLPVPQGEYASRMEMGGVPVSGTAPIEIKTKNCVPHENIQANIHYNVTLLDKWAAPCRTNDRTVVFCSGGPSLKDYFDDISKAREGNLLACVKHAHDMLIENDIIPDICVLLDPRSHVQDFIENPHPKVTYMVSSMVHPTTTDRLLEKGARVFGYHAHVGAEEDKVLSQRGMHAMLIGGGCSAAMRGISVFYTLGFHRFKLYGYDLCYTKKPFKGDKLPMKDDGTPQFLEVTAMGRKFWTDPEKIAQAQDFEKMLKQNETRIELEAFGPGIIPHMWATAYKPLPTFEDLIGGTSETG